MTSRGGMSEDRGAALDARALPPVDALPGPARRLSSAVTAALVRSVVARAATARAAGTGPDAPPPRAPAARRGGRGG